MSEPKTFMFQTEVKVVDCDGVPIREGDVLQHVGDEPDDSACRGVVVNIHRSGDRSYSRTGMECVGDMSVQTSCGCYRIGNQYTKWKHIPREDQTYEERLKAWHVVPYTHDVYQGCSADIGLAIDGMMALLPTDPVDWDHGPWPDDLSETLNFLVDHLSELTKQKRKY